MTYRPIPWIPTSPLRRSVTVTGIGSSERKRGSTVCRSRCRTPCICCASLRSWVQTHGRGWIRRPEPRTRFRPKLGTPPARQTQCRRPGTHAVRKQREGYDIFTQPHRMLKFQNASCCVDCAPRVESACAGEAQTRAGASREERGTALTSRALQGGDSAHSYRGTA